MADAILYRLHKQPEDYPMIGDRFETSVLLGLNARIAAALTLTGATDESILKDSPIKPTYIIRQLADLLPENN